MEDDDSSVNHGIEMPLTASASVEATACSLLDRHERRREAGLPTVSALVGTPRAAVELARGWAARRGRELLEFEDAERGTFAAAWLDRLARRRDLRGDAVAWLAARLGRPVEEVGPSLAAKSPFELGVLLATAIPEPAATGADIACRLLLEQAAARIPLVPTALAAELHARLSGAGGTWARVVAAVNGLLPRGASPALIASLRESANGSSADVEGTARLLAELALELPGLTLILAVGRRAFDDYLGHAPACRAKALVCATVIPISDPPSGGPDPVIGVRALAPAPSGDVPVARPDDEARSLAERLLFDRLESMPETAGLFRLNANPGLRFGPARDMEVDLLARSLDLAVEVDGFHHFQDDDAYRRDRRKDVALQTHGFLVVRVLADDVFGRVDDVLTTIVAAVASRRRRGEGGG